MIAGPERKKLIEVALPLEEINAACKADKGRAHGTIKNLHKWFAPMPVPAWRALLFAALVDDPGDDERRAALLDVIKRLVACSADVPDEVTVGEARAIIRTQFPDGVPAVMDPFSGGGSTLVEAQRLGLPSYASDLNPVPVLISRTLIELLPKVYNEQPLHSEPIVRRPSPRRRPTYMASVDSDVDEFALLPPSDAATVYTGLDGLAQDVTYYARRVLDRAWDHLAQWFPTSPGETIVAWLWARTITCPNPACGAETVLTTTWWLSKKKNALAWIEPVVANGVIDLRVVIGQRTGSAPDAPKAGRGASFNCLNCKQTIEESQVVATALSDGLGRATLLLTLRGLRKSPSATGTSRASTPASRSRPQPSSLS